MNKEEIEELKDITIDYGNGNYIYISPNEISVVGDKIEFIKKSEPNELDIEQLQQQNKKYKEVIDKLRNRLKITTREEIDDKTHDDMVDILDEVE